MSYSQNETDALALSVGTLCKEHVAKRPQSAEVLAALAIVAADYIARGASPAEAYGFFQAALQGRMLRHSQAKTG